MRQRIISQELYRRLKNNLVCHNKFVKMNEYKKIVAFNSLTIIE